MREPSASPKAPNRRSSSYLLGTTAVLPPSPHLPDTSGAASPDLPEPVYGLEVIRRSLGLSKAGFYGSPDGPYRTLPIIALSERRRGVRKSDYETWLAARTRRP